MKFRFDILKKNKEIDQEVMIGDDPNDDLQLLLRECKTHLTRFDEQMLRKAFHICYDAHKNKLRKSGEPYYTHPLEVARIVIKEIPLDDISVAAALLHNVVDEGEKYSMQDLRHDFGPQVAQIVEGVSKIKYVESQHINTDAQMESYRRLLLALFKDVRIILVKLADRLHNMRTLENLPEESQRRTSIETLEIYAPFANRFGLRNIKWELEDLGFKYLYKDEYDSIKESLMLTRKEREGYVERFIAPIKEALDNDDLLKKLKVKYEITGRAKHIYSIYNKTIIRNKPLEELYDLFAVRLIIDSDDKNLCFYAYGIIAGIYRPVPETFKDYISDPKKNGYQSIHTAVVGPSKKPVEVQVRTRLMHLVSEKGVAAHFKYKRGALDPQSVLEDQNIQSWMDVVREIFENAGNEHTPELLDSVRRNLFQDEIYVFTPDNEFKKLPKGSTALDFAFLIHSRIGYNAIGAKINGRVVPLYHKLQSADQIEILTSKNQKPSKEWLNWVVTSKANQALLKYFRDEDKKTESNGKDILKKKSIEHGFNLSDENFEMLLKSLNFQSSSEFFYALGSNVLNPEKVYDFIKMKLNMGLNKFPDSANTTANKNSYISSIGVRIEKKFNVTQDTRINFAECCKPLPGDEILATALSEQEVLIHKSNCKMIAKIIRTHSDDVQRIEWSDLPTRSFLSEIRIIGEDRDYILQDISTSIIKNGTATINSVNLNTFETLFDGEITLKISSSCNLDKLFSDIRSVEGVKSVERISPNN